MKKIAQFVLPVVLMLGFTACSQAQKKGSTPVNDQTGISSNKVNTPPARDVGNWEKIVVAQGCFWCVEEIFEAVKGVKEVVSGYAGGTEENPTYEEVGGGSTSHAEAVEITYNPEEISYEQLLKVYFNSGDITQVNGQGPDHGRQYRSIVFYNDGAQKKQVEDYIKNLEASGKYSRKIAVEIAPLSIFYPAEDYHQDFVKRNPNQGYVRGVSVPRYKKAIQNFPELLK
ncbi:MAG: peptide-methionine (S)-S-oxide reductase MsrA [Saprospiraceae bacterium]